jgi:hypothetical protein
VNPLSELVLVASNLVKGMEQGWRNSRNCITGTTG